MKRTLILISCWLWTLLGASAFAAAQRLPRPDCDTDEKRSIWASLRRTGHVGHLTPLSPGPCSLLNDDPASSVLQDFKDLFVGSLLLSDATNSYCRVITDDEHRYDYRYVPTQYEIGDDRLGKYYRVTTTHDLEPQYISPPGCWISIEALPAGVTDPIRPTADPSGINCEFTCTFVVWGERQTATIPGSGPCNSVIFRTDSFDGLTSTRGFEVLNLGCQLQARRFDTSTNQLPWVTTLEGTFRGNYFRLESDVNGGFSTKTIDGMSVSCLAPR